MRTLTCLLAVFGLSTAPALAQITGADYQPFRPGVTPFFGSGAANDSLVSFHLRPVSGGASGAYRFDPLARPLPRPVAGSGCSGTGYFLDTLSADNHFGATLLVQAGGEFVLLTSQGDTFRLRTRVPVGTRWAFGSAPGRTATLLSRGVGPVLTTTDSLVTIGLSTGQQLVLSRQYGLVEGPSLMALVNPGRWPAQLFRLYSLPEAGLGPLPPTHSFRVFDFQPGDEFLRVHYEWNGPWVGIPIICQTTWTKKRYLTRQLSANGDTLLYTCLQQWQQDNLGSGAPGCWGSPGSTISPVHTVVERVVRTSSFEQVPGLRDDTLRHGQLVSFTRRLALGQDSFPCAGRYEVAGAGAAYDSCAQSFSDVWSDRGGPSRGKWLGEGLGTLSNLIWYRKNGQVCGQLPRFLNLLAAPALLSAESVQLFPNPAVSAARLALTGTKGGPLTLTVTDALGRLVWRHTQLVGLDAEIALPVVGWAPGGYYVRVALPEGARTLRLVRE